MSRTFKAASLAAMLTAWSGIVMAQTSSGGVPTGVPQSGMDWVWILVALIVVAALLFYFLGRGRGTRL
ncbi:hypothetical protein GGR34_003892 [Microvirga flocculans]|uniref:LPXTG cell wall anchor domain-containing protein n=1 Tax=Microvirga flocculans TaxID=217168 RepID=A0A7W6IIX0_9HYPH|nr:hypothetical protein [Microvirga flocculans]MBB4042204.1 hypothetical protein [Microvirga flocculans]